MMKQMWLSYCFSGLLLVIGGSLPGGDMLEDQQPLRYQAKVEIDPNQALGSINPLLSGHNIEAADPRGIFAPLNGPFFEKTITHGQGLWDPQARKPFPAVITELQKLGATALRYPGGCLTHNFDWRKTVGAPEERGLFQFGLDEYLETCFALGVEPVICITDYALPPEELPRHAAELVEYLNAPAIPAHPWAMKRAELGHFEPYGVRYFEMGNESDHGNHDVIPARRFTAEQYSDYVLQCAQAMRAVDPEIQIGVWLSYDPNSHWSKTVLAQTKGEADFAIIHCYAPDLYAGAGMDVVTAVAGGWGERLQRYISAFQEDMKSETGRILPLAVTEFNTGHGEDWRYSFLGGLMLADAFEVFARPENKIFMANYWHILNDFWGTIHTGYENKIIKRHASTVLLEAASVISGKEYLVHTVEAPLQEAPPLGAWPGASGSAVVAGRVVGEALSLGNFILTELNSPGIVPKIIAPNALQLQLRDRTQAAYMNFAVIHRDPAFPLNEPLVWKLSFEARFLPDPNYRGGAVMGLGLVDQRGWDATLSGLAVRGAETAREWQEFGEVFVSRGDSPGVFLVARLESVDTPVSGTLEFRNIRLQTWQPETVPAFPMLTALAVRAPETGNVTGILVNKSFDHALETEVWVKGFSEQSVTIQEYCRNPVRDTAEFLPSERKATLQDGRFKCLLPPHSLTVFEVKL